MGYRELDASLVWDREVSVFIDGITRAEIDRLNNGVQRIAEKYAPQIQTWMAQHAIWVDRTGNARQGLHTDIENLTADLTSIALSHGVDYGYWLEVAYQGKYAILQPALDYWFPIIMQAVSDLLDGKF